MARLTSPSDRGELGQYLWDLRQAKGLSQRDVEEQCDVSNAYLSQLETGRTRKPAPAILHELAELYGGSFETMMELAGHVVPRKGSRRSSRLPAFAKEDLTPEEEEELLKYLAFIRIRGTKREEG